MNANTLWTKDFRRVTLASAASFIGGEAMNLPLSLLVFDQTGSTFLSSVIMVCGMAPDVVLSVTVAPLIDRGRKKRWIVGLDLLFLLTYLLMAYATWSYPFRFLLYVAFTLTTSTLSVFYRLAYDAWYPDLIPVGFEQKGFTVSGMLYDSICVVMAPVASILYTVVPLYALFLFVAALTAASIVVESGITETGAGNAEKTSYDLGAYFDDLKAGFAYLKKERGVRNIFTFMSISIGVGDGNYLFERTYFQTTPRLGARRYGFGLSAYTAARMVSAVFLYKKDVPEKKRFDVVKSIYIALDVLSGVALFLPYPLIVADYALQGGLSNFSYTLRETATKSYIPKEMRARVGAIFNLMICVCGIGFNLLAGLIGERLPLRAGAVGLSALNAVAAILLIYLPARDNRPVYEARRQ